MKVSTAKLVMPGVMAILIPAGCSARQVYEAATGWRQNECQKILESAQRARCMEQAGKDYETYRKEGNASP